jgi:hypothetical protein
MKPENLNGEAISHWTLSLAKCRERLSGHVADTPANRKLLQEVADDAATTLGVDKWGNTWSARILEDGRQVWV